MIKPDIFFKQMIPKDISHPATINRLVTIPFGSSFPKYLDFLLCITIRHIGMNYFETLDFKLYNNLSFPYITL